MLAHNKFWTKTDDLFESEKDARPAKVDPFKEGRVIKLKTTNEELKPSTDKVNSKPAPDFEKN